MSGINVEFAWTTDGIRSEISARFDSVDQALAFRDALDRSIANAEAAAAVEAKGYRRGVAEERARIAAEFERLAGDRNPALSREHNQRFSEVYANVADRIRHPERSREQSAELMTA